MWNVKVGRIQTGKVVSHIGEVGSGMQCILLSSPGKGGRIEIPFLSSNVSG